LVQLRKEEQTSMAATVRLLAYGDPHGDWKSLIRAVESSKPDAILIVGDCDLVSRPLPQELAPVWRLKIPVWYVPGNHDADSELAWQNLAAAHPGGNLHGRVHQIGGYRIAGLGGTFESPIWNPKSGQGPTFATREAYFESVGDHRTDKA
jgi:Icc-related predicted phosphoesterase